MFTIFIKLKLLSELDFWRLEICHYQEMDARQFKFEWHNCMPTKYQFNLGQINRRTLEQSTVNLLDKIDEQ